MQTSTYMMLTEMGTATRARKADVAELARIRAYVGNAFGPNGVKAFDVSLADKRPIDAFKPGSVQRARAIVTAWGHGHAVSA